MDDSRIHFCPHCGSPLETRLICREEHPACPRCGWIYFSDPKVAAAVLVKQGGKVLLTRRVNEPSQGMWTLPAGFVDALEDPARAAERECLEETGLEVRVTGLVDVIAGREHPRGADMVIIYRAEVVSGSLKAGDDADQVAFFPLNQLPPLAFRSTRQVLELENGHPVVLVTGGGRGLGRGIARAFGAVGARVIVHYHTSRAEAEQVAAEIDAAGGMGLALQADVTASEEVERLFAAAHAAFGRLDVLINNAGTYPVAPLLEMSAADWDGVINSNLRSAFLCTQAAARIMKEQKGGVIINIASVEGSFPAVNHAHYNAAKAGLIHFTRTAARELGVYQIRVNAISPGLIDRPGLEQDWPDGVGRWRRSAPLSRLGMPDDIANACLFLASPAAAWITGVNLVVDGGVSTAPAF